MVHCALDALAALGWSADAVYCRVLPPLCTRGGRGCCRDAISLRLLDAMSACRVACMRKQLLGRQQGTRVPCAELWEAALVLPHHHFVAGLALIYPQGH